MNPSLSKPRSIRSPLQGSSSRPSLRPSVRVGSAKTPIENKPSLKQQQQQSEYEQAASPIIQLIVGGATEALRLVQTLTGQQPVLAADEDGSQRLPVGDIAGVLEGIQNDFKAAYFVTGVLTDAIYDVNTYFADPTVRFTGRELWKKNLQLLVPFLIDPSIELYSLTQVGDAVQPSDEKSGRGAVLKAEWRLVTGLKLPWRPFIDVRGSTTYTLHWPDNNRIVKHVEAWDIDGLEALRLVLSPGRRST